MVVLVVVLMVWCLLWRCGLAGSLAVGVAAVLTYVLLLFLWFLSRFHSSDVTNGLIILLIAAATFRFSLSLSFFLSFSHFLSCSLFLSLSLSLSLSLCLSISLSLSLPPSLCLSFSFSPFLFSSCRVCCSCAMLCLLR